MDLSCTPAGMTRRHFMQHMAGASALALPAVNFTNALAASASDMKKRGKACDPAVDGRRPVDDGHLGS